MINLFDRYDSAVAYRKLAKACPKEPEVTNVYSLGKGIFVHLNIDPINPENLPVRMSLQQHHDPGHPLHEMSIVRADVGPIEFTAETDGFYSHPNAEPTYTPAPTCALRGIARAVSRIEPLDPDGLWQLKYAIPGRFFEKPPVRGLSIPETQALISEYRTR